MLSNRYSLEIKILFFVLPGDRLFDDLCIFQKTSSQQNSKARQADPLPAKRLLSHAEDNHCHRWVLRMWEKYDG